MNYKNELKKKISADYERRVKQWMSSDPAQLVDAAETIAAARLIRDNLDDAITTQDAKFLLDLDDPLGYVTDRWISENGADNSHKEELQHCVWTLQQDFGEGQAPATVRDFLMEQQGRSVFTDDTLRLCFYDGGAGGKPARWTRHKVAPRCGGCFYGGFCRRDPHTDGQVGQTGRMVCGIS